ncbi:MAG: AmmeMemoRadiSam system protein A [Gammaproteobacteria bacterium SHHR-1]
MVPMPSSEALSEQDQLRLLQLAQDSIQHGLEQGCPLRLELAHWPQPLQEPAACFVTLELEGRLRGCIGHLQAIQPLAQDVADNAFAAAFQDPRFGPLRADELPRLELHISVLGEPRPLSFDSEADLIAQLRPGEDGLILQDGPHRGTFLPSVWAQLPEPEQFWRQLKRKAGLPADYWSASLRVQRYSSLGFGRAVTEIQ